MPFGNLYRLGTWHTKHSNPIDISEVFLKWIGLRTEKCNDNLMDRLNLHNVPNQTKTKLKWIEALIVMMMMVLVVVSLVVWLAPCYF